MWTPATAASGLSASSPVGTLHWLAGRIRPHFWFKTFGTSAFMTVFFTAYIYLLKAPASAVTVMPLTPVDDWVTFQPWALPIYLSLWFYVSLPVMLMQTRGEIIGFGWRAGLLCLIGLAVFYFWPNAVPPVNIDWDRYPGASMLKGVDAAGNACPSLHVASSVFSAFWLDWTLPDTRKGRIGRWLNLIWCVLIAYSTMAIKQHVAVDVLCGALLAVVLAWLTKPRGLQRM